MKYFVRYGLVLLCCFSIAINVSSAQQKGYNTYAGDSTNVYFFALTKYIQTLKIGKNTGSTIYIQADNAIAQKLPKRHGHFSLKYVHEGEVKRRLKKSQTSMALTRIVPVKILGPVLWVKIAHYDAALNGTQINFEKRGGLSLSFKFNCDLMEWEFLELLKLED